MRLLPAPLPGELPGDLLRRRARFGLVLLVLATLASVAAFGSLARVWPFISALDGVPFLLAATLLGSVLAGGPLLAMVGLILTVWCGVESVYRPRQQATPALDRLIVATGLLVWCVPSLGLLAAAAQAILTGRIHFSRPPRDYLLSTDPIAFWQGVGFWLIGSISLGYLAWRYWKRKFSHPTTS